MIDLATFHSIARQRAHEMIALWMSQKIPEVLIYDVMSKIKIFRAGAYEAYDHKRGYIIESAIPGDWKRPIFSFLSEGF